MEADAHGAGALCRALDARLVSEGLSDQGRLLVLLRALEDLHDEGRGEGA